MCGERQERTLGPERPALPRSTVGQSRQSLAVNSNHLGYCDLSLSRGYQLNGLFDWRLGVHIEDFRPAEVFAQADEKVNTVLILVPLSPGSLVEIGRES
jgi:hypothetical protein